MPAQRDSFVYESAIDGDLPAAILSQARQARYTESGFLCGSSNQSQELRTKDSKAFEQRIHQIYELLEGDGAEVTWDDHIPDPDNPSQSRQIDVTIRRDGKLTLVECRHHQSRQDVQWIEGLMGRRVSLGADAAIAVSSSGFTSGALKKAQAQGIITRDLLELTEIEVKRWGQRVALTLHFYQYSDLEVSLCFERESIPCLDGRTLGLELKCHPALQSLFNAAAQQLSTLKPLAEKSATADVQFDLRLEFDEFRLSQQRVIEVGFRGKGRLVSREIMAPAVFAYGQPEYSAMSRDAIVEKFRLGETMIVHDGSRISLVLDVSQEELPPFCQFRFFQLTAGQEVEHHSVEVVGIEKLWVHGRDLKVRVCSERPRHIY